MPQKQGEGKIEWTEYTSNVLKGRCGFAKEGDPCHYCYAEDLWKRFSFRKDGTPFWNQEIRIDEKELTWSPKKPSKIFLCSMTDPMHPIVPIAFIDRVVEMIASRPQHIYQILTKWPERYEFVKFPPNAWIGVSIDGLPRTRWNLCRLANVDTPALKFISFEPLIFEPKTVYGLRHQNEWDEMQWIIIGGDSSRGAVKPPDEWADRLISVARSHNIPVFVKDNYEYHTVIKEFPEEENHGLRSV